MGVRFCLWKGCDIEVKGGGGNDFYFGLFLWFLGLEKLNLGIASLIISCFDS